MPVIVSGGGSSPGSDMAGAFAPPGGAAPNEDLGNDIPDVGAVDESSEGRFVVDALDALTRDSDDDGTPVDPEIMAPTQQPQAPAQQQQAPVVEPAPTQQPVAPVATPQAPAVAQPTAQPAQQAGQTPAQPQASVSESPLDPFSHVRDELAKNEPALRQAVADAYYQITPDEMNAFLGGDSKVVSQALARVHLNSVGSVMAVIAQQLPVMIANHIRVNQTRSVAEDRFWASNPKLNRETHRPLVGPIVQAYKYSNPNADEATIHKMVGMLVAVQAGIPIEQVVSAPARASNGHQSPQVRTPGPQVRQVQQGFVPAATGSNAPPGQAQSNQWDRMTEIFQLEDKGAFEIR